MTTADPEWCNVDWVTIDILPDDVLLEVFDCYVQAEEKEWVEAWHTLVHVCQKWRMLVFASPRRLNLQVICRRTTRVGEMLDVWPSFPIVIQNDQPWVVSWGVANTLAALEHSNRICGISLWGVPGLQMGEILAGMYKPFPALTELTLQAEGVTLTINPDLFLGGSAPLLEELTLEYITFPGLPKLLSSATHLVYLRLHNISYSGFRNVPSEAMVTALSTSTRLENLILEFEYPRSQDHYWPPRDRRGHRTRTLFPALTWLRFQGDSEYLEDLVAGIDAPQLNIFHIRFFLQSIFDIPQLAQFINRTPNLEVHDEVHVVFYYASILVNLNQHLTVGSSWKSQAENHIRVTRGL